MVIAVDGPAGSGKSSVCRLLAKRTGCVYLDTGAMYRAVAWALRQKGGDPDTLDDLGSFLSDLPLCFTIQDEALRIFYEDKPLEEELREPLIAEWASKVSRKGSVRELLTRWQRRLSRQGDVVAEGRDMTTVVFADTPFKIYLTADLAVRAERRLRQHEGEGVFVSREELLEKIRQRDEADENRSLAPLRRAPDAFFLDTSSLSVEEAVDRIREFVEARQKGLPRIDPKT